MGKHWTDERIGRLIDLAADGLSASQIAAQFGDCTRNSVIGRLHRMGLTTRVKRTALAPAVSARRRSARAVNPFGMKGAAGIVQRMRQRVLPALEPTEAADIAPEQSPGAITLLEATDETCKWPVSEPSADMLVCGSATVRKPYCAKHARLAYQPRKAHG